VGFYFLSFQTFGNRPALLLSYIFSRMSVCYNRHREGKAGPLSTLTGLAVFTFLATWTAWYLSAQNLYVALAVFSVRGVALSRAAGLHRFRKIDLAWWSHLFPALALVLILMPVFNLREVSFVVWPLVFCVIARHLSGGRHRRFAVNLGCFVAYVCRDRWMDVGFRSSLEACRSRFFFLALSPFSLSSRRYGQAASCRRLRASRQHRIRKLFGALNNPVISRSSFSFVRNASFLCSSW
jgi:hypothetical protein